MVLDTVDDDRVLSQSNHGKPPLGSYIPQAQHGSILVTSRSFFAAANKVEVQNIIHVRPMSEGDVLALLKTRVTMASSLEAEAAKDLVQALEHLPLAITHASAYISCRVGRETISTYLKLFRANEENQIHLLNNTEIRDLRRDSSLQHPVMTTWQMCFDQIRETRPKAADLLALMSMFDRQSVSEDLLLDGQDRMEFEDSIAPLLSFSFISADVDQQSLNMHRLVQLSMIDWLMRKDQLDTWKIAAIRILAAAFPDGDFEHWTECQRLLPHAERALAHPPNNELESDLPDLADHVGWYMYTKGEYGTAERLLRQALQAREKRCKPGESSIMASVNLLGIVLNSQGKYEEAERMHHRVLKFREANLGLEHHATLDSVDNLGLVLKSQGKYEEAEMMHRRALSGYEKILGPKATSTLSSIHNISTALRWQGKYEEAEILCQLVIQAGGEELGSEHPLILGVNDNLGLVLKRQGKNKEGEAMHRKALKSSEKVLGPCHLATMISVSNLATVLEEQDKYAEAETLHRRALATREKLLGPEHPHTRASAHAVCRTHAAHSATLHLGLQRFLPLLLKSVGLGLMVYPLINYWLYRYYWQCR